MRIVEDTETRLVVEDRPWLLGLMLIFFLLIAVKMIFVGASERDVFMLIAGPTFVAGILWAMAKAVRRARLSMDKADGTAIWQVRDYKGLSKRQWALDALKGAIVEESRGEGVSYRISLKIDGESGRFPLTPYYSGFGRHRQICNRINEFAGHHD